MQKYKLDKVFTVGTDYRAETDKGLQILAVGTDDTVALTVKVAGAPCLELCDGMAPLAKNTASLLGPLELGDEFIVVPPTKVLQFSGTSGKLVRLLGYVIELEPGEKFPSELMARYEAQKNVFMSYLKGAATPGENAAWANGVELTAIEWTCPTAERWLFAHAITAAGEQNAWGDKYGKCVIRVYLDDKPLDLLSTTMGPKGLDAQAMKHPYPAASNMEIVTFKDRPIVVEAGHVLKVTAQNVSGSDWAAPGSGLYNRVTVRLIGRREYL